MEEQPTAEETNNNHQLGFQLEEGETGSKKQTPLSPHHADTVEAIPEQQAKRSDNHSHEPIECRQQELKISTGVESEKSISNPA